MKIAYITAGAAGMFCGSCLHDNTLVAALQKLGHDALLIPTYTPIRTDEIDVSQSRIFFGGINVYLQQKFSLFRHTPRFLDRWLDAPSLLNWVSRFAVKTQAQDLGDLTLSMLRGELGHQCKEIEKLVDWLAEEVKPELIQLSNVLLSGMVHRLKERLPHTPILASLQGDDIFLEYLPSLQREAALDLIHDHCQHFAGFVATSRFYADFMATYLRLPREKIEVIYPGLNLKGHGPTPKHRIERPFTIGYFARICPEKGLQHLVEAFRLMRSQPDSHPSRLRISGWLGESQRAFFDGQIAILKRAGLDNDVDYVESPDHESKVRFLQSLDVLSVPTVYREPKGLYVLEAWANGIPVVQPRHGSFPELIEATGGGLLVEPENPADLAKQLQYLREHPDERTRLGQSGRVAVEKRFHASAMAEASVLHYRKFVS